MAATVAPPPRLFSIAFISIKDEPIFVQAFNHSRSRSQSPEDLLKANYAANCALDVFEERVKANPKATECYLGLLFSMDALSVYGYITPSKMKVVAAFTQSEAAVKDSEVIMIFKALHLAYYRATSNPFLRLGLSETEAADPVKLLKSNDNKWKRLEREVNRVAESAGPSQRPVRPV